MDGPEANNLRPARQMDEREARLPAWTRELIADLRRRVQYAMEPAVMELTKLRPQVQLLKARNEALTELLDCAARGGHKDAQEIMEIIRTYDLVLAPAEPRIDTQHPEGI